MTLPATLLLLFAWIQVTIAYRCELDWRKRCNGLFPMRATNGSVVGTQAYFGTHSLTNEGTTGLYRLAVTSAIAMNYTRTDIAIITPKFLCLSQDDTTTCYNEANPSTWPTQWSTGEKYTADPDTGTLESAFDPSPVNTIDFSDWGQPTNSTTRLVDWGSPLDNGDFWIAGGMGKCRTCRPSELGVYSMSAIDQIIAALTSGRFPSLTQITVAGHSAGAQFVQRYASFGLYGNATKVGSNRVKIRYVLSEPGSFIYPTAERPYDVSGSGPCHTACTVSSDDFGIPEVNDCDGEWDDYKYGFQNLGDPTRYYPARNLSLTSSKIPQYRYQDVTYLIGSNDNAKISADDCQNRRQGFSRRQVGNYLAAYVRLIYPAALHVVSNLVCGHDSDCVFQVRSGFDGWCRLWGRC
ncbi:hypothetical protein HDV00_004121 [Rhizophlyctis rosea]|nr:hypothetical protein HDV00_004121 [Rhizophlyctis rosea]